MYASAQNQAHHLAILGSVTRTETAMIDCAGIWIDHRKAFVVTLSADGEDTKLILSGVEKHPQHSVPADDRRQRALTCELNKYYDAVISTVCGYENLFLFGPGEAKHELRRRVLPMKVCNFVTAADAADKMTDLEIIAKVREHFGCRMAHTLSVAATVNVAHKLASG
jgi:hypothetical protein